jgi:hypothetical protein
VDTLTADPFVVIEDQQSGYVRYRNIKTGRRWEVWGTCDRRGDCLVGAVVDTPDGKVQIADKDAISLFDQARLVADLDVPVTPEFTGCCPFIFVELKPAV